MNFTDYQVLTVIRANPGSSMRELLRILKREMRQWPWSIGKVQRSVQRLEESGRIRVDRVTETIQIEACRISEI